MVTRKRGKTLIRKRSIGHRTSVSLEDAFWDLFNEIAAAQNISVVDLVLKIDPEGYKLVLGHPPVCSQSLSPANSGPPGPPMTLGNMRSLAKGIAPDRAKRAEVGGHFGA